MECFGTTDFDNNSRLITLSAIIINGLHCIYIYISFKGTVSILRPRRIKNGQRNNVITLVLNHNGTDAIIGDGQRRPQSEENRRSGDKPSVPQLLYKFEVTLFDMGYL